MTKTPEKIQLRGNCQCCGRDQAVQGGFMSKHGYVVKKVGGYSVGWFSGVCSGHSYEPMQVRRDITDSIIKQVRADVKSLTAYLMGLQSGLAFPTEAWSGKRINNMREQEMVPYKDAPAHHQRDAVQSEIWRVKGRISSGTGFADQMQELVDEKHGQPLSEVVREEAPAAIRIDEQRCNPHRGVVTAYSVHGGMVYWKDTKGFKGACSTRTWRALVEA